MIENFSLRDARALNNSMYGDNDKGHTYCDIAILHEEPYKKAINDMIISTPSCKTLTSLTKREKWDLCKIKIKEFSIKYCKIRSATKKNELHLLETEINNIDQLIINNNDDDFLLNRRSKLKN